MAAVIEQAVTEQSEKITPQNEKFSRRKFLRDAVVGVMAAALTGCSPATQRFFDEVQATMSDKIEEKYREIARQAKVPGPYIDKVAAQHPRSVEEALSYYKYIKEEEDKEKAEAQNNIRTNPEPAFNLNDENNTQFAQDQQNLENLKSLYTPLNDARTVVSYTVQPGQGFFRIFRNTEKYFLGKNATDPTVGVELAIAWEEQPGKYIIYTEQQHPENEMLLIPANQHFLLGLNQEELQSYIKSTYGESALETP